MPNTSRYEKHGGAITVAHDARVLAKGTLAQRNSDTARPDPSGSVEVRG
ncbi:MAG: hypothetical protein ACXVHB_08700 [Solirubrobacteraceae bacterium]